jgi:hypothetical protein
MLRRAPLQLHAEHFSHFGEGVSWFGKRRDTGLTGFRESDGITIAYTDPDQTGQTESPPTGEQTGQAMEIRLETGEWVSYRIETRERAALIVEVLGAADPEVSPPPRWMGWL